MKFIDDLYHLYRNHLTGDEEDAVAIVLDVLHEQEREDLIKFIKDMDEDEIFSMVGIYLIELMKRKMADEGVANSTPDSDDFPLH
jgi:hypothetical protein